MEFYPSYILAPPVYDVQISCATLSQKDIRNIYLEIYRQIWLGIFGQLGSTENLSIWLDFSSQGY